MLEVGEKLTLRL